VGADEPAPPNSIYSADSSALIHAWRRAYRPKNFGFIWERVEELISVGRLFVSVEVFKEIERKDDDLHAWCKDRGDGFCVQIDDAIQLHLRRIMENYPKLVDLAKGRSAADPFVIALAATSHPRMVVVSEENPGKVRIPDVCNAEGIECIRVADLIEREDWHFG